MPPETRLCDGWSQEVGPRESGETVPLETGVDANRRERGGDAWRGAIRWGVENDAFAGEMAGPIE